MLRTLPRLLLALTFVAAWYEMLGTAWLPVDESDAWWLAAAGRELLRTHAIPRENLFSFVDTHQPWIMHEWALGPAYALGLSRWGPPFLVALGIALQVVGLALLLANTLGRAERPLAGSLLACLGALAYLRRFRTARPSHVALLFPLWLCRLAFGPRFGVRQLSGCVLLEWLWANAHGSFPLGVALLLLAAIERVQDRRPRLLAALGAALITFVNPYGAELHLFVLRYWTGSSGVYREIHAMLAEFGSMRAASGTLIGPGQWLAFAATALLSAAALCTRGQRLRGAFCLGLLLMAARNARHLELCGLLSCCLLVPWADQVASRLRAQLASERARSDKSARTIVGATCALGLGLFVIASARRAPEDWLGSDTFLAALPAVPDGAHVYVPFHAAGQAIWYGYPRGVRVFYDSRNDCYRVSTLRDFDTLARADTTLPRALQLLDASHADAALLPATHPLATKLDAASVWRRLPDPRGLVFVRGRLLQAEQR